MNKKIIIFGGGTVSYIRSHLALAAPAYGRTAKQLAELSKEILPNLDIELKLTKMAGGPYLETNLDIECVINAIIRDDTTKVVIMAAALCDFEPYNEIVTIGKICKPAEYFMGYTVNQVEKTDIEAIKPGKYSKRMTSTCDFIELRLKPSEKIIRKIRQTRKDIFLVGFKETCGETEQGQYIRGLDLCKKASCNLVLANDTQTRLNMVITPEESKYHITTNREEALRGLLEMVFHRTHLTFTRSTVVAGDPIKWDSAEIPQSLRTIVNYCIEKNAYKPFNGVTAGHFAYKVNDNTFLTSIRKTNFNKLNEVGLVKIVTDGPDTVLAYGAKPSVGGQSQRIVFHDHQEMDCIVHCHVPILKDSLVPTVSQREFECGSMQCGDNTSHGLKQFGNLKAVFLDNHGPNIVFHHSINPQEVIDFIEDNFDLSEKTGGFVSIKDRLATSSTLETAQRLL